MIYFQDCLIFLREISEQPLSLGGISVIDIYLQCVPTLTHTHSLLLLFPFFSTLVFCVVSDCSGLSHQRWLWLLASSVIVPTLDFVYTSSWGRGFMSKLWWNLIFIIFNYYCSRDWLNSLNIQVSYDVGDIITYVGTFRLSSKWYLCIIPVSPKSNIGKVICHTMFSWTHKQKQFTKLFQGCYIFQNSHYSVVSRISYLCSWGTFKIEKIKLYHFMQEHSFILDTHIFVDTCMLRCFSRVWLFETPWTIARQAPLTLWDPMDHSRQAPLSMGFPRQEYWSGLPFPSPEDLPEPGIKPTSHVSCIARGFFTSSATCKVGIFTCIFTCILIWEEGLNCDSGF